MIDIDFKYYKSVFWKRFPIFLLVWILFTVLAVAVAFILPAIYRSQATILVESASITLVDETVTTPAEEQIKRIETLLMTRSNLLEISDRFDIFTRDDGYTPTEIVDLMKESTEFSIVSFGGTSRNGPTTTAFNVAFLHTSPVTSSRVAGEMLNRIMERNRELRAEVAENTFEYFKQERARLLNRLTDLETQMVNLKNENKDALPERLDFNQAEMSRTQERLIQMDRQELAIKEQRDQLQRVLDDPTLLPTTGQAQTPQQRQLDQLKLDLAEKSVIYSERSPQILQLQNRIAALEDLIRGSSSAEDVADTINPALEPLRIQVRQLNNQLALLSDQRIEMETELDRLQRAIEQTPNVENQLKILEREHATSERQYKANEEKLVTAEAGNLIEQTQQGERFTIVEQPEIPDEPESPNRILIAVGGTAFGLMAGVGLIVLLEILNTSVRRPADLINGLGIQPFATIPYIATARETRRRRIKTVLAVLATLVIVPAAVYAVHWFVIPIDLVIDRVLERFGLDGLKTLLS